MASFKGIEISDALAGLVRHMRSVEDYRESLGRLQASWDTLSLLGELSGSGAEISGTREAFERLTGDLLNQLGHEIRRRAVAELRAKSQNTIDILVRNLFERTADIGFLAADTEICAHLAEPTDDGRLALERRFREYVAKYSVYSDVILFDPAGRVVARLAAHAVETTRAAFLGQALASASYVECHGAADVLPPGEHLVYAHKVVDRSGAAIGVLALVFRLADEMDGIFEHLQGSEDRGVLAAIAPDGRVIASSCGVQLPRGHKLPARAIGADGSVIKVGGREYLATCRAATPYQGYVGPNWYGLAMVGLEAAFDTRGEAEADMSEAVLDAVTHEPRLFSDALRAIPEQAARIQRDLSRSVWNGSVRQSASEGANASFAKTLLWEIATTGRKTQAVFEDSIGNLRRTVVASVLDDVRSRADFAVDVMDRNLYERANDCRWWALDGHLRAALASPSTATAERASRTLAAINDLYTVYTTLVLFDAAGTIVAVSRAERSDWVGTTIAEPWLAATLRLRSTQGYAVSAFAPTPLYDDAPTFIHGAALTAPGDTRVIGGIGIVFDSTPQFAAMLTDALPRDDAGAPVEGAFALFADADGMVIASSDPRWPVGRPHGLSIDAAGLRALGARSMVVEIDGIHHALGAAPSRGYREYKTSDGHAYDVVSICGVPLGAVRAAATSKGVGEERLSSRGARGTGKGLEIATFHVGGHWLGLPAADVVEAIDADGLSTNVGAREGGIAGYKLHRGAPLPVLGLDPAGADGSAREIVVARSARGGLLGLLVDRVGPIPEIEREEIMPADSLLAGWRVPTRGLVSRANAAGEPGGILIVLDGQRLTANVAVDETHLIAAE